MTDVAKARDLVYVNPAHGWTCFHCGETFLSSGLAEEHFGKYPDETPACQIKRGHERNLVATLREAEAELQRYRAEDTDLHRQIGRMSADHGTALCREEEKGYERGLRDARERASRIIAQIKNGLKNGGARNACDEIAASIGNPNRD